MRSSFLNKLWKLPEDKAPQSLLDFSGDALLAEILYQRAVSSNEDARYYLSTGSREPLLSSPYEIPELEKAVQRIEEALERQEKIIIYGDYDVDGTTSSALMVYALKELGAKVDFYIPHRIEEGYGLNSKAIVKLKSKEKAKLLITCDCGVTNLAEVELANSIGLDVIVTDHHSLPEELPKAVAVLNPKFLPEKHPLHWLPGVGVAFKLAEALLLKKKYSQEKIDELLDLVCLGMIADLAPLRSENRLLVQKGLKVLQKTQKVGLRALLEESGTRNDEEGVGFSIAPRINAAGRLYDARAAVELFLLENEENLERAKTLASSLSEQNRERQELCELTFQQALKRVRELDLSKLCAIVLEDQRWHHGVVGIVASRLVDKFNRPVFLGVLEGEKIKGSARGVEKLDLFQEMSKFAQLFDKFGGHKAAAGFSLSRENWEIFKKKFEENLQENLQESCKKKDFFTAKLKIDRVLQTNELNLETVVRIEKLAPFGFQFSKPIFCCEENFKILEILSIGKKKKYPKFLLSLGGKIFEGLFWQAEYHEIQEIQRKLNQANQVKLAFNLERNFFRGESKLVLVIKDLIFFEKNTESSKSFLKKLISFCREKWREEQNLNLKELVRQTKTNQAICLEGLRVLQRAGLIKINKTTEEKKQNFRFNPQVKKLVINTDKLEKLLQNL